MAKLNAFADLVAKATKERDIKLALESERKQREIAPLLSDMFKTVEKAKSLTEDSASKQKVVELVKELESSVAKAAESTQNTVKPSNNTETSESDEKRFEKLLKQLQNDFATLKRYVDAIPVVSGGYGGGGSGEVRISRMDDVEKVTPNDGDTLVWSSTENKFVYMPINTNIEEAMVYAKRIDSIGDELVYKGEAVVGSLDTDPVWRISRIQITDNDVIEKWASGSASFSFSWTDRLTYPYS